MKIRKLKIEIIMIQQNLLTKSTVEFLHYVIQEVLKLFALNLVLTHLLNFFIVTKRATDCHHFCKWKFLLELYNWHFLQQLCRWQRLLHLCSFRGDTFCYRYAGRSFCCNYAGDCFCCNYAVRSLWSRWQVLQQICGWQFFHCNYADGSPCCSYAGEIFCSAFHPWLFQL